MANFLDEFWNDISKDDNGDTTFIGEFGSDGKYHSTYSALEDLVKGQIRKDTPAQVTKEQQDFEKNLQEPKDEVQSTNKQYLIYGGIGLLALYLIGGD